LSNSSRVLESNGENYKLMVSLENKVIQGLRLDQYHLSDPEDSSWLKEIR